MKRLNQNFGKVFPAAFVLAVSVISFVPAFGGSIVINDADPDSSLKYLDESGSTKDLRVTWTDLQLISRVKAYLLKNHGGKDLPFMIDRASKSVSILTDRTKGTYSNISFSDLKDL